MAHRPVAWFRARLVSYLKETYAKWCTWTRHHTHLAVHPTSDTCSCCIGDKHCKMTLRLCSHPFQIDIASPVAGHQTALLQEKCSHHMVLVGFTTPRYGFMLTHIIATWRRRRSDRWSSAVIMHSAMRESDRATCCTWNMKTLCIGSTSIQSLHVAAGGFGPGLHISGIPLLRDQRMREARRHLTGCIIQTKFRDNRDTARSLVRYPCCSFPATAPSLCCGRLITPLNPPRAPGHVQ